MNKCKYHEIRERINYRFNGDTIEKYEVCNGTRECELCSCGGDKAKCDFYESIRKEGQKKMNTAEMWVQAQKDGKTYICKDVCYSKKTGLVNSNNFKKWSLQNCDFDTLMEEDWTLYEKTLLTRYEAEIKYGIKIID